MVVHFENTFITDRAMVCTRWFGCNALLAYRNYLRYSLEEKIHNQSNGASYFYWFKDVITSANVKEFIDDQI